MHKKYQIRLWRRQFKNLCCFPPLEMFLFKNQSLWTVMIKQKHQFTLVSQFVKLSSNGFYHVIFPVAQCDQKSHFIGRYNRAPQNWSDSDDHSEGLQLVNAKPWPEFRFPLCWSPDVNFYFFHIFVKQSFVLLHTLSPTMWRYVIGSGNSAVSQRDEVLALSLTMEVAQHGAE